MQKVRLNPGSATHLACPWGWARRHADSLAASRPCRSHSPQAYHAPPTTSQGSLISLVVIPSHTRLFVVPAELYPEEHAVCQMPFKYSTGLVS